MIYFPRRMHFTRTLIRGGVPLLLAVGALTAASVAAGSPPATTDTTPTTTTPTTTTPTTTTPTTTTPTTTTPTTTTPTTPTPATAAPALYLSRAFYLDRKAVTIPRRTVTVSGVVRPYVPGQTVVLRESLNGRQFKKVTLRLKPSARRVDGGFVWPVSSPGVGAVTVSVQHAATAQLSKFSVNTSWTALNTNVGFGSRAPFVALLQQRLLALHVYVPQTGVYDLQTGLAVDAYHRLLGMGTSQLLGPVVINDLLNGVGTFKLRFPNQGRHAEGDLSHQLLALANGSKVYWIFPISSGKPSTPTVLGSWPIYYRVPGYLQTVCTTRISSSVVTQSMATTRRRTTRPAMAACACRSSTRLPRSTGSASATGSTPTTGN